MKKYTIILFAICFFSCNRAESDLIKAQIKLSKIDSLKTEKEIERFIRQADSLNYGAKDDTRIPFWNYRLKILQNLTHENVITSHGRTIADSIGIKNSFFKADFDNNGYNDLVVTGYFDTNEISYDYVLMNYAKDSIEIKDINAYWHAFTVPKILKINNQTFLQVYYPDMRQPFGDRKVITVSKKLVYKFGGFIEFNENPNDYSIEKIEFSTLGCMGTCPVFKLAIDQNKSFVYTPEYYNSGQSGNKKGFLFRGNLTSKEFAEIEGLLNYIDFPKLEKYYPENASDGQSSILKITYANGKVKIIEDHLFPGTYGLRRLYEILFELRNTAGNTR